MDPEVKRSLALQEMRAALPMMLESHALIAQVKMSQYRAYVAAGFTEAQALELCKSNGPG